MTTQRQKYRSKWTQFWVHSLVSSLAELSLSIYLQPGLAGPVLEQCVCVCVCECMCVCVCVCVCLQLMFFCFLLLRLYNNIQLPSKLSSGCDYSVFRVRVCVWLCVCLSLCACACVCVLCCVCRVCCVVCVVCVAGVV